MKKLTFAILTSISVMGASTALSQDDPPPPPPENQPDLVIKGKGAPVGDGIYGRPVGQGIRVKTLGNRTASYTLGVQNDGTEDDRIRVRGTGSDRKFRVSYKIGDRNVTSAMKRGVRLPIESEGAVRIGAEVKATRATKGRNAKKTLRYFAGSAGDRSKRDSAVAVVYKKKVKDSNRG